MELKSRRWFPTFSPSTEETLAGIAEADADDVVRAVDVAAGHMDVNGIDVTGVLGDLLADVERSAAENVKRVHRAPDVDPFDETAQSPYEITAFTESKTVWHPMGA